jgi:hypothetical protein
MEVLEKANVFELDKLGRKVEEDAAREVFFHVLRLGLT